MACSVGSLLGSKLLIGATNRTVPERSGEDFFGFDPDLRQKLLDGVYFVHANKISGGCDRKLSRPQ